MFETHIMQTNASSDIIYYHDVYKVSGTSLQM